MKLLKIIKFSGTVTCKTGLCIKGANSDINIGGADNEIIKNPITGEPYIPGSSLKGKMRSQLEKKYDSRDRNLRIDENSPCGCGQKSCMICTVFGAHMNPHAVSSPTRIIVRDSMLTENSRKLVKNLLEEKGSFIDLKTENSIKRSTGTSESLRTNEVIPSGTEFEIEILLQIFDYDKAIEENIINAVKESLKLVEYSYIGGSGSRGYGKVEFKYDINEIMV